MILILTEDLDAHADRVIDGLRRRGADWLRFNPARFPADASLDCALSASGEVRAELCADGRRINLGRISAVWYRRPQPPEPPAEVTDPRVREYVAEECRLMLNDLWHSLVCRWLPALPSVIRRADFKAAQLRQAGAVGFELPDTLFTNRPEALLEFYQRHPEGVVTKLAGPAFFQSFGAYFTRYTELVSPRDLAAAHALRLCPALFQAHVPKQVELRVTVVGTQVFAAEIHSQASNHTRLDWRRYDMYQTAYLPHALPSEVENQCRELVARLGLVYGAIDLVLTPDGRYVFLEINPNGQYLWVEHETGLPISEAVCDLLCAESGDER
jgi:hypothetical protein